MRGGPFKLESLEDLHELAQRFLAANRDNDTETRREILHLIIENEQEAYRRKIQLLAELKTLKKEVRGAKSEADRVARLIALFKFSADLRAIGYDELADKETGDKATVTSFDTAQQLQAIGVAGIAALTELLTDPSIYVRCSAAIHLLRVIPEQAVPVLKSVREEGRGTGAAVSAGLALSNFERKTNQ